MKKIAAVFLAVLSFASIASAWDSAHPQGYKTTVATTRGSSHCSTAYGKSQKCPHMSGKPAVFR